MTRHLITALAAAALLAAPTAAKSPAWMPREGAVAKRLAEIGSWEFSATQTGPDGNPECYETWIFKADGTGTIISGEQRVTTTWKVETVEGMGEPATAARRNCCSTAMVMARWCAMRRPTSAVPMGQIASSSRPMIAGAGLRRSSSANPGTHPAPCGLGAA